jgi:5'-phosphate synthase pdxT subunit
MVDIPVLGEKPLHAVFIRGPVINAVGADVEVLAEIEQGIVMARQAHYLVTAFHPEITSDTRVHQLFINMVAAARENQTQPAKSLAVR